MNPSTVYKGGPPLPSLPSGFSPATDGDWCVMSAEVPPEDEAGGDIIRVAGMRVPEGIPLQVQHMRHAPDGSPTTIGRVEETRDGQVEWKGATVPAKYGRFSWAPTELASKYKALWPKYINRVSIGAWVRDSEPIKGGRGYDIRKSELFELSIVTFGANPAAQAAIRRALGDVYVGGAPGGGGVEAAISELRDYVYEIKSSMVTADKLQRWCDDVECAVVSAVEQRRGRRSKRSRGDDDEGSVADRLAEVVRSFRKEVAGYDEGSVADRLAEMVRSFRKEVAGYDETTEKLVAALQDLRKSI